MKVTEVKLEFSGVGTDRKILAYAIITLENSLVIKDLKLIRGQKGAFVSFPDRKLCDRCPECGGRNPLRAYFCNNCGEELDENRSGSKSGRDLHANIVYPITNTLRSLIEKAIIQAYNERRQDIIDREVV